jgi:hypothetical protein
MVFKQRFKINVVSETTQARTRASARNQDARTGGEEPEDMEEDLTDDESVVIGETPPSPQPRRTAGNQIV